MLTIVFSHFSYILDVQTDIISLANPRTTISCVLMMISNWGLREQHNAHKQFARATGAMRYTTRAFGLFVFCFTHKPGQAMVVLLFPPSLSSFPSSSSLAISSNARWSTGVVDGSKIEDTTQLSWGRRGLCARESRKDWILIMTNSRQLRRAVNDERSTLLYATTFGGV